MRQMAAILCGIVGPLNAVPAAGARPAERHHKFVRTPPTERGAHDDGGPEGPLLLPSQRSDANSFKVSVFGLEDEK